MTLFLKECKAITKSIIYFVFIGVMVLFYVSQLGNSVGDDISKAEGTSVYEDEYSQKNPFLKNPLIEPPKGAESYGYVSAEIPEQVMPNATAALVREYWSNQYVTYPVGFYKTVKLNESERAEIEKILTEITGKGADGLLNLVNEQSMKNINEQGYILGNAVEYGDVIPIIVDYELFKGKMARVDEMLGGGSYYAVGELAQYGSVPVTYEEKLAEYNEFIAEDKVTNAYARLFCDYLGIVVVLFSVFVPTAFFMRDRRAKANELIYSRRIGSSKLIAARYTALVVMMLLPVVLLSMVPLAQLMLYGGRNGISVDAFAFLKYIAAWLLPSLMTTTAVALLLTTLTDTPIAIVVQFLWSFLSILTGGAAALDGGKYGMNLIIRHNTVGNLRAVTDNLSQLVMNRVFYAVLALAFVGITIFIYEQKRRGRLDVLGSLQKIFGNRQGADEADASL